MNTKLDYPLDFESGYCGICRKEDADWVMLQFLDDGAWRNLESGKTLREQGIDEGNSTRIYCIHKCAEPIVKTFISVREMTTFLIKLHERW